MFQALFASVAIALIVFFIKPIHVDPRFGLGVGAFFAAVGNNIFVGSMLPPAHRHGQRDWAGNHLPYPGAVNDFALYPGHNGSRETEAIFR
jgi:hypothetical protein